MGEIKRKIETPSAEDDDVPPHTDNVETEVCRKYEWLRSNEHSFCDPWCLFLLVVTSTPGSLNSADRQRVWAEKRELRLGPQVPCQGDTRQTQLAMSW